MRKMLSIRKKILPVTRIFPFPYNAIKKFLPQGCKTIGSYLEINQLKLI